MSAKRSIFVGREAQLFELNDYWRSAFHEKQGKVVFLVGEAGIGKTSLVERFRQDVLKNYSGVQYAYAQCDQIAGDISPYAPFVQILNSLTEQAAKRGDNWFVEYMREVGPDVLGMVPVASSLLTAAVKSVDFVWQRRKRSRSEVEGRSQFEQKDIFQQFADSFRNIATKKNPLLLCIDDWHWADKSSTNLLFHMARQLRNVPILLLATYRPHDAKVREHRILDVQAEMERDQLCASISLGFLSHEDVRAYLKRRFPEAQFEPGFINWLMNTTSGNALFTTEYVNLLLNEKLLTPDGQLTGDLNQITSPENVEAVIRTRIGYLDREARDTLAYGSVEGEQFTTLLLSQVLRIELLSLIRRLRAIEENHHLIASLGKQTVYEHETTVYRFVHALIHHALYNMLEEELTEINCRLLELRGKIYDGVDEATKARMAPELMHHAAEAKDYLTQARYALAAAESAAKDYAHDEVLKHCTLGLQALDKLADTSAETVNLRIDLLLRQARAETDTGSWQEALKCYGWAESLARLCKDVKLLGILNRTAGVWRRRGDYEQFLSYLKEVVDLAEKFDDKAELAKAYSSLGLDKFHREDHQASLEWFQKSLTIYEQLNDKSGIAWQYVWIGNAFSKLGKYDEALGRYEQVLDIAKKLVHTDLLAWGYNQIGLAYKNLGDYKKALVFCRKARKSWKEMGLKKNQHFASHAIGLIYEAQSDYMHALEYYQEALDIREKLGNKTHIDETAERIAAVNAKIAG